MLLVACADETPPTFPADAAIAHEATATSLVLKWPAASDDNAVTGYELKVGGADPVAVGAEVLEHRVDGLEEASSHSFELVALDAAGNRSSAIKHQATTKDETAPHFAKWARGGLSVKRRVGPDELELGFSWTRAADNIGPIRYRFERDGSAIGEAESGDPGKLAYAAFSARSEPADFAVIAIDAAGNESRPLEIPGRRYLQDWLKNENKPTPQDKLANLARFAATVGPVIPLNSTDPPFAGKGPKGIIPKTDTSEK
jgi:hypothetical protein